MMAAFHHRLASTLLAVLFIGHAADGNPTGPPASACADMSPQHGANSSSDPLPYDFELSQECYTPGEKVAVALKATGDAKFRGFFVQARTSVDDENSHGTFDFLETTLVQHVNCFGKQNNTVGHKSNTDKTEVLFFWIPSSSATGRYTLVATVVQTTAKFWVKALTKILVPCSETTTGVSGNTTTASTTAPSTTISSTTQDSSATAVSAVESLVVLCIAALLGVTVVLAGGF